MGYYINNSVPVSSRGAEQISKPKSLADIPEDKALICEVDNGPFKANGLAYSEEEFQAFDYDLNDRPKRWFLMDKKTAHELAGYGQG